MKNIFIGVAMAGFCAAVSAQGYVGAVMALSKLSNACTTGFRCDDARGTGFRIFAGHRFTDAEALQLGGGVRINRVEVSGLRFGKQSALGQRTKFLEDSATIQVPVSEQVSATALVVAAGTDYQVHPGIILVGRLGLAYVTATVATTVDGRGDGSKSQNAIRPYVGAGVEYLLPDDIRFIWNLDWTRYSVDGRSGSATQLGLGAAVSF